MPPSTPIQIAHKHPGALTRGQLEAIDDIFFEASGRSFCTAREREIFRERWLGRYLQGGTDALFVASSGPRTVVGYVVGALEHPGRQARFADIPYFRNEFADLCGTFPAHLHVNLAPGYRGQGIGARLIEAFALHARAAGAPGMHVVTGQGLRNVRFYLACGFAERGSATWNGRNIVLLGRMLNP